jgi:hypothetical protein
MTMINKNRSAIAQIKERQIKYGYIYVYMTMWIMSAADTIDRVTI